MSLIYNYCGDGPCTICVLIHNISKLIHNKDNDIRIEVTSYHLTSTINKLPEIIPYVSIAVYDKKSILINKIEVWNDIAKGRMFGEVIFYFTDRDIISLTDGEIGWIVYVGNRTGSSTDGKHPISTIDEEIFL